MLLSSSILYVLLHCFRAVCFSIDISSMVGMVGRLPLEVGEAPLGWEEWWTLAPWPGEKPQTLQQWTQGFPFHQDVWRCSCFAFISPGWQGHNLPSWSVPETHDSVYHRPTFDGAFIWPKISTRNAITSERHQNQQCQHWKTSTNSATSSKSTRSMSKPQHQ